jgi:hypothetical protein
MQAFSSVRAELSVCAPQLRRALLLQHSGHARRLDLNGAQQRTPVGIGQPRIAEDVEEEPHLGWDRLQLLIIEESDVGRVDEAGEDPERPDVAHLERPRDLGEDFERWLMSS